MMPMVPQAQPSLSFDSMQGSHLTQSERKVLPEARDADVPPSTAAEAKACPTSIDPLLINNISSFTSKSPQTFVFPSLPEYQPSITSPFGDFLYGDQANLGGKMSSAPESYLTDPSLALPPLTPGYDFASYLRDPAEVSTRPSSLSVMSPLPAGQKALLRTKTRSVSSSRPQGKTRSSLSKQAADRLLKPSPQPTFKRGNNGQKQYRRFHGIQKDVRNRSHLLKIRAWEELPSDVVDVPIW